jgi:micrococcal nuclease
MYRYTARLVRVIDGDTYVLDIDLGFHVHTEQHVRLLGIDCPEKNTPAGRSATIFATLWWAAHGNEAVIDTGRVAMKTFDRWVARVQSGDDDLEAALRLAGHVKAVEHLG